MRAPISPAEHTKLVSPVANKQLAIAKAAAHPIKTQHLEEAPAEAPKPPPAAPPAPASAGDDSDDSIDLLPPKEIKGGKGKALESSIEEAFEDKPSSKNSHYLPDHTDKEVHLWIIFFLLLGTVMVFYLWKSKDDGPMSARMSETKSKVPSATGL